MKLSEIIEAADFLSLVNEWKQKAQTAASLELQSKQAFCQAYIASKGGNETARTSEARLKSHEAAMGAEMAKVEAKAAEFLVEYMLASLKPSA